MSKVTSLVSCLKQGSQMVYFQTKNPTLGNFLRALDWKMLDINYGHLKYFTGIGEVLFPFGTFSVHLVYFFPVLVTRTKKNLATLKTISIFILFEPLYGVGIGYS
jgi:hypothetical protein